MTKEQLLNQVSEQQIYEKFCAHYKIGENVSSPFSEDKKASFRFYKNKTFKCYSSGKQGDVFQFVADLNELDCKQDFHKVLSVISEAFALNGYANENVKKTVKVAKKEEKQNTKEIDTKSLFTYNTKLFEEIHLNYFLQGNWNVTKKLLDQYKVFALDKFEYWNSKKEDITKIKLFKHVLGFAYKVNNNVELYVPKQDKTTKFFYNQLTNTDVFGLEQLKNYKNQDFLIVSAGKKDCLILNANGFPCVSFRSENHYITKEQIKQLRSFSKTIVICYDNDMSGINASKQLVEKYGLLEIVLPNNFNDVADFFEVKAKGDFKVLIDNAINFSDKREIKDKKNNDKGTTIFHVVEDYLSKNYRFRFNTILLDIEYQAKKSGSKWNICNEDSLFIEMQKKGINIQMAKLISILKSDFVPKYNPINAYFRNLKKWDGNDYVSELVKYVTTPDEKDFAYHLKKWLARSVKCMLVDGYFNKQAFIITDKGNGQNIGKSHFTKWLCPPSLPLNRSFEDSKKDNLIKLATNAFIILDELDGISRKDLNSLKALFSMDEIRVRLPYGRREETVQRTANFIGSTNEENFLNDPTGSVRWLVFDVSGINWDYSKKMNINDIWAQAYALAKDVNFDESFTKEDVKNNELRNETYQIRTPEAEMISLLYEIPNEKNKHKVVFLTSTEILIYLKANSSLNRLSPVSVGKALKLLKFERTKKNGVYGYNVAQTNRVLGVENQSFKN